LSAKSDNHKNALLFMIRIRYNRKNSCYAELAAGKAEWSE